MSFTLYHDEPAAAVTLDLSGSSIMTALDALTLRKDDSLSSLYLTRLALSLGGATKPLNKDLLFLRLMERVSAPIPARTHSRGARRP